MEDNPKKIYRLDDQISFRQCSLFHGRSSAHGNCTNFDELEENWKRYFVCNQNGIHLHCTKHPEIEFDVSNTYGTTTLRCSKCQTDIEIDNLNEAIRKCLRMLNIEEFKGAKLIRLDDWYVPEVKKKVKAPPKYWVEADVKTDKDGDTIVVLYVGHAESKEKAQFFIKPEKCQLTSDHKDLDPAQVLAKIEVTLKDKKLIHEYERDENELSDF